MNPEDAAFFASFINRHQWTFAKTMPKHPHWYIVRKNCDPAHFERAVRLIREHGEQRRFYRKRLTYLHFDGLDYWTMGAPVEETTIINRAKRGGTE